MLTMEYGFYFLKTIKIVVGLHRDFVVDNCQSPDLKSNKQSNKSLEWLYNWVVGRHSIMAAADSVVVLLELDVQWEEWEEKKKKKQFYNN